MDQIQQFKVYNTTTNKQRKDLIMMVKEKNYSVKEAAEILKLNHSTAKTVLRVYKKENRIKKKSLRKNSIFVIKKINKFQNPKKVKISLKQQGSKKIEKDHQTSTGVTSNSTNNVYRELIEEDNVNKKLNDGLVPPLQSKCNDSKNLSLQRILDDHLKEISKASHLICLNTRIDYKAEEKSQDFKGMMTEKNIAKFDMPNLLNELENNYETTIGLLKKLKIEETHDYNSILDKFVNSLNINVLKSEEKNRDLFLFYLLFNLDKKIRSSNDLKTKSLIEKLDSIVLIYILNKLSIRK